MADRIFSDTIFALATPPGKSGVAVIRLSGPGARGALLTLSGLQDVTPRRAHYVALRHPKSHGVMDRGLAFYFAAPRSFTGEEVVELQLHGSLAVIREVLDALSGLEGLRPAEPGEFTRRAFINGKMDLMEAEGLADLIEAETGRQKSQAMRQMEGELSLYYERLRLDVTRALAHLEAYIDFPDEEIPDSVLDGLKSEIELLQCSIKQALSDGRRGERLREGIHIVILGAPNVGKSSLLNRLAKREAAIVSARAGTTRDVIEIHMDIAGYPVILADTAGLRDSGDEIEAEGIRRARARADEADIKLVLFDGGEGDKMSLALLGENALPIVNKCDLPENKKQGWDALSKPLFLSTKTGEGVDALMQELENKIVSQFSSGAAPFITRNRHRALLSDASKALENSLKDSPLEIKCEELRRAALAIGKVTGKIQVDDVLDLIFREFCIGK